MSLTKRLPARFTLAHGLMILAGLLTFVLVNSALRDRSATLPVVLASEQSEAGRSAAMQTQLGEVSASTPGAEFYATVEDLRGQVLARPLPSGQPIMKADLVPEGAVEYRTFAIAVPGFQIEGLRLAPNDRVDVVGFDEDDNPLYLATDLVVDSTSSRKSEGLGSSTESYITIRVDDAQALRLSKGQLNGPLNIVRSTGSAPIISVAVSAPAGDSIESADGERP